MRFDVSELKTLNECSRKWQLSSRNAFHMRPKVTNGNLYFGSLFHECLHTLYLGGNLEKVITQAVRECNGDKTAERTIEAMLRGYGTQVLPADLERFKVLDIEHNVNLELPELMEFNKDGTINENESVHVCGSIDMICLEKATNTVYGFEHKTTSKFRPEIYIAMDEQPRVYYLELQNYVAKHNDVHPEDPWTLGGIYLNEVRKVQRSFEYSRHLCSYGHMECLRMLDRLGSIGAQIRVMSEGGGITVPNPSYMKCSMCDYATICETYKYNDLSKEAILDEFQEEFEVREMDHLDEKVERRIEG